IDACRIGDEPAFTERRGGVSVGGLMNDTDAERITTGGAGRWPTNVVLDDTTAAELDEQTGTLTSGKLEAHHARAPKDAGILGAYGSTEGERGYGDSGGASRFFPVFRYEAKADAGERPRVPRKVLRLRRDLTPEQVDHVRARLREAGVEVD